MPPFSFEELETSEGAGDAGASQSYEDVVNANLETAAPVEEAAAVEEVAAEETAPAAEEPPAWFKQYLERADPLLNTLAQALEPEPAPQAAPQQVDLSQLDMQNPEHVAWLVNYQIQQAMSPYEPIMGMQAEQQGRDVANKYFDQLEQEVGKFDREQALTHYTALMAENPGAQPEQVLQHAAREIASYEQRIREQAIADYKAKEAADEGKIAELASAKNQPAAAGTGTVENEAMPTGRDKYEIMAARWSAKQGPTTLA